MSIDPNPKRILFLSWRDIKAPKKGGAEVFTHEMLKRRNLNHTEVTHFSPMFEGAAEEEIFENVKYVRKGSVHTVIFHAFFYFVKNRRNFDYVVDQCNTHRFFTPLWVSRKKRIFFIHQTTKEIWLRQMKKPFGYIGYKLENLMLKIYRKNITFTVSDSTAKDLLALGFDEEKIYILPEGIDFKPWSPDQWLKGSLYKFTYVGRYSTYKGIDATVEAFCRFQKKYEEATLGIIGKKNESYIENTLLPIINKYGTDPSLITYYGFVSDKEKLTLMSQSHCLIFPSDREGWGLTITEGAAVGTPSIVYNSAGLRDAVRYGKAGFMTEQNTVENLVLLMEKSVEDSEYYSEIQNAAYSFSKKLSWDRTAEQFDRFMKMIEDGDGHGESRNSYNDL